MAIKRTAKGGFLKTLLSASVMLSIMNETQAQELKVVEISEDTRDKYKIYQDRFTEAEVGEDVATNLSRIAGHIPFTLPISCVNTEALMGAYGSSRAVGSAKIPNQLIIVEEGVNKVAIEYGNCKTYVNIEGVTNSNYNTVSFSDVTKNSEDIYKCVKLGLLSGIGTDHFAPSEVLTTTSALTGLNRVMMNNLDLEMKTSRFIIDDLFQFIDDSHWAYNHILNVASKLDGEDVLMFASYGNRIYQDNMTRGTMARIIHQLFKDKGFTQSSTIQGFTDINGDDPSIDFVSGTGIMIGDGSNSFRPNDTLSREEFASILVRIDNLYKR